MTPESTASLDQAPEAPAFEPAAAPAVTKTKKSKKNALKAKKKQGRVARNKKKKKSASVAAAMPTQAPATSAVGQVQNTETLPVIGDSNLASAPIAVDPMVPPVPFGMEMEQANAQPNWLLAAFVVAGIVGLIGIAFRVRRQSNNRKRKLVFSA